MTKFDEAIRAVLQGTPGYNGDPCLSAELIAAYGEKRLEGSERDFVERHLVGCAPCLDEVVLASRLASSQKGIEILPGKADDRTGIADVMVSFLSHTVEVVTNLKDISVLPVPDPVPAVRGRRTVLPNAARFVRVFPGVSVQVDVDRSGTLFGDIMVTVTGIGFPSDTHRCTLLSGERELASFRAEDGKVQFERVAFGRYVIRISRNRTAVGEISLALKED